MNRLNDGVASPRGGGGRGGRGLVYREQSADRHSVQVMMQQERQLLVLSPQSFFVFLQSFSVQQSGAVAPRQRRKL